MTNSYRDFLDRYGPCMRCLATPGRGCDECGARVVLFCVEQCAITPDDWQERVLRAYGRAERRIAIKACHGPGKTLIAAVLIVYQSVCRFPQHTVATAPSKGQLEDALMKNVENIFIRLQPGVRELFELKTNRLEHRAEPSNCWFSARTARAEKPEALQGVHCDGGWVLLIADEAPGVDEAIFEAAAGSMSGAGAQTLLLGNPTRTSGFFFDVFHKLADMWHLETVAASMSKRVDPDFVVDIARRYGEDSNAYRVRVLGEFPDADEDTVIARGLVVAARKRDIYVPGSAVEVWGMDPARSANRDANALVARTKLSVTRVERWRGDDLMKTAGKIKYLYDDALFKPELILIDSNGLGGGVLDRLREQNLPVRGINVSETGNLDDRFRNLRTELAWKAREWLEKMDKKMPLQPCCGKLGKERCVHDLLEDEMVQPRYSHTSAGKLLMESKDDMKRRHIPSPNLFDALCLTFAGEPSSLLHGSSASADGWSNLAWNKPLHRDLSHV